MTPEFEEYLKKRQEEDEKRRAEEDAEGDDPPQLDAEDEAILDEAWEKARESGEEDE